MQLPLRQLLRLSLAATCLAASSPMLHAKTPLAVSLGGVPLTVQLVAASTLTASLGSTSRTGTYLLSLTGKNLSQQFDVTLGAVPPGPHRPHGTARAHGLTRRPGRHGTYRRTRPRRPHRRHRPARTHRSNGCIRPNRPHRPPGPYGTHRATGRHRHSRRTRLRRSHWSNWSHKGPQEPPDLPVPAAYSTGSRTKLPTLSGLWVIPPRPSPT